MKLMYDLAMILKTMLPGVLKELMKHVPTVFFKVVDWNELASEIPKLSRRLLQKEGYQQMVLQQKDLLLPFSINVTDRPLNTETHQVTKWSGEKVLHLYFAQLFSPEGLFLDLRSQHFYGDSPELKWHPTGLWTTFADPFRSGLLDLYEGFYMEDNDLYMSGLKQIGLIAPDWPEQDKQTLSELFKAQFGSALSSEMSFDLEHFRAAILKTSDFMLKKQVNISKDFLYLGIYLVTLYSHLEQGHEKYPVRDIYLKVRRAFRPQI